MYDKSGLFSHFKLVRDTLNSKGEQIDCSESMSVYVTISKKKNEAFPVYDITFYTVLISFLPVQATLWKGRDKKEFYNRDTIIFVE